MQIKVYDVRDSVTYNAVSVRVWLLDGQHVVLHCKPRGVWNRWVHTKGLSQDRVEVGKCHELVHRWSVSIDGEELIPKFGLNFGCLCHGIQCPGDRGTVTTLPSTYTQQ